MFKEVMHNTLKHSECSKAWLLFENGRETMRLTFRDNGKGLNGISGNGQGLKNVRKRAEQIRAKYEIDSEPEGTTFKLMVELDQHE
jgi:signal transduction histidine kinase